MSDKRIIIITQGVSRIVNPIVNQYNVVGIIESPRREVKKTQNIFERIFYSLYANTLGKSRNLKIFAKNKSIPYYLMDNGSDASLENWVKDLKPDLIIIYLMSQLLRKNIFDIPTYKTINLHPSYLPEYRGPNPWFWYYYHQKKEAGITLHFIDEREDTGDIIYQEKYDIPLGIKSPDMQNLAVGEIGVKMILKAIENVDNLPRKKQPKLTTLERARNIKNSEHLDIVDWNSWSIKRIWHLLRGTELWLNVFEQPSGLNKGQRWVIEEYEECNTEKYIVSKVYREKGKWFVVCGEGKIYLTINFGIKRFILNIFK